MPAPYVFYLLDVIRDKGVSTPLSVFFITECEQPDKPNVSARFTEHADSIANAVNDHFLPAIAEGGEEGCEFCNTFDFRAASYEVDKYGARVLLACGYTGFPKKRQFRFCPVCGRELKNNDEEE